MLRLLPGFISRPALTLAAIAVLLGATSGLARAAIVAAEEPQISAGAEAAAEGDALRTLGLQSVALGIRNPAVDALLGGPKWDAIKFLDVAVLTGSFNIPPDPMGASGPDRNIDVVNTAIESWDKTGTLQWRASLKTFVTSLVGGVPGTLATGGFDPKVVYDQHAGRFVVCLLERKTTAPTASRILVAVSKTNSPASATTADWYYYAINSQLTIAAAATFADYPGLEVDEEVIYITTNQFRYTGTFAGARLWIVHKAPFYAGGAPIHTLHDYYAAVPGSVATTTMPALVFGAAGASPGVGTYLASYSGLNDGISEFVQVVRVDDPTGSVGGPFFKGEFVNTGTIDNIAVALPKGPQLGSAIPIETGDRRMYDAVWRNNNLWCTATTLPLAGPDAGQTTTHWWRISTALVTSSASPAGVLVLADHGEAGANDIAAGAMTAWSGIAVNSLDEMKLSYALFAPSIYASAGLAGRQPADLPGTLQPSVNIRPGVDSYVRTFTSGSTGRNRWGDYTGMCVDPSDDRTFWTFNEWADVRGNPTTVGTTTEDGQWATVWASCAFTCGTVECPPVTTVTRGTSTTLQFCINNCASLAATFNWHIENQNGWCGPINGTLTVPANSTGCVAIVCDVPADAPCGFVKPIIFRADQDPTLPPMICETAIMVDCGVPTRFAELEAEGRDGGVMLHWTMADAFSYQGFRVYREEGNTGRTRVSESILTGGPDFSYFDAYVANGPVRYWLEEIALDGGTIWHGPVAVTNGSTLPTAISFAPARPNPFGASTAFALGLPKASTVRLNVFDAAGRLVRTLTDGVKPAGNHTVTWDGTDLSGRRAPVGMYLVVLNIDGELHRQKVLLGR